LWRLRLANTVAFLLRDVPGKQLLDTATAQSDHLKEVIEI